MLRHCLLACAIALATIPPCAAGPSTASTVSLHTNIATTDLYGKTCHTLESRERGAVSTRYCRGANGYALLVHENQGRSSIDIVAPGKEAWQLDFWDVVEPGVSQVGRKAEWHVVRGTPRALLVRVDMIDTRNMVYPKTATSIAVARIDSDGACVTFKADAGARGAEAAARRAALDRSRKCLGAYAGAAMPTPM